MTQETWKVWVRLGVSPVAGTFIEDVTIYDRSQKPGYHRATITLDSEEKATDKGRDEWRTIESAPRDGTVIDVWCHRSWNPPQTHERRTSVYWCRTHVCWQAQPGEYHYVETTFRRVEHDGDRWPTPPTGMPLPSPPTGEK